MRSIWVTFTKEGVHRYPGADTDPKLATGDWDDVSFLGVPHRHIFHFRVRIEVSHNPGGAIGFGGSLAYGEYTLSSRFAGVIPDEFLPDVDIDVARLSGFVEYDTRDDSMYPTEGVYASEAPIVPRKGGSSEDDAYLVTFLIDENSGTSEFAILDAREVTKGPICRLALPHKISSGVHSTWVERAMLG